MKALAGFVRATRLPDGRGSWCSLVLSRLRLRAATVREPGPNRKVATHSAAPASDRLMLPCALAHTQP
jgi:hypothetical protein